MQNIGPLQGKIKTPLTRVPPRAAPVSPALPEGLLARFLGKRIAARLIFGDEIVGTLSTIGRFELLLTLADGSTVCVFKGAIASISEAKP